MYLRELLAVDQAQAFQFFVSGLQEVTKGEAQPKLLVYNASILAHYAMTSTRPTDDSSLLGTPVDCLTIFDNFVLDRSGHQDPEIMEAIATQCLLLSGFFRKHLQARHNLDWYAAIGANWFDAAAHRFKDENRIKICLHMAATFGYWRQAYELLNRNFHDFPYLIKPAH